MLYQYDLGGRLLEETDGQGNDLADYIYLAGLPIAVVQPSGGQTYFLHDDRLGTPQIATDSNQATQWTTSFDPFGTTATGVGLIVQDLRLPGQEFDQNLGPGVYHNGFRDYASQLGRYIQSDPIGLGGGANHYLYAGSNPAAWVDRDGLDFGDYVDSNGVPHIVIRPLSRPVGPSPDDALVNHKIASALDQISSATEKLAIFSLVTPFAEAAPVLGTISLCTGVAAFVLDPTPKEAVSLAGDVTADKLGVGNVYGAAKMFLDAISPHPAK